MAYYPYGNKYTPVTTPLHIAQLLMMYLKEAFKDYPDGHPYQYTDNFNTTGILFDTVFNKEAHVYGGKPVILINRGSLNSNPAVIGDTASSDVALTQMKRTGLIRSSAEIKIISSLYGHADALSNEVYSMLLTARRLLPSISSIHVADALSMTQIQPFDDGDHEYYSQIQLGYTMQYKWGHIDPGEILNSIYLKLTANEEVSREVNIDKT